MRHPGPVRSAVFTAVIAAAATAAAQPFSNPVGCENCISYWYYLDEGGTDWNCGSATYSDHNGTDYSLRGGNLSIANGNEVVAAAAGVVTVASDGNYDQCTSCGGAGCGLNTPGGGFSNYVVIDHGTHDTTYGHMRNGSIMVQVGDSVECGQVIGHIGSAGCSTGAHLHFQPRPKGGSYTVNPLDPYAGPCSPTPASLWGEQGPYRGLPGRTCGDVPTTPQCPADTYAIWTCTPDGGSRRRCIDGVDSVEECPWGCIAMSTGTDDVCALPPDGDNDGARADTDCDDTRSDVHPGAVEVCGDGLDQDCSGSDLSCGPSGAGGMPANVGGMTGLGGTQASGGTETAPGGAGGSLQTGSGGWLGTGGTLAVNGGALGVSGFPGAAGAGTGEPAAPSGGSPDAAGCACRIERSARGASPGLLAAFLCGCALGRRRWTARAHLRIS